jgi:hypothetical protein
MGSSEVAPGNLAPSWELCMVWQSTQGPLTAARATGGARSSKPAKAAVIKRRSVFMVILLGIIL